MRQASRSTCALAPFRTCTLRCTAAWCAARVARARASRRRSLAGRPRAATRTRPSCARPAAGRPPGAPVRRRFDGDHSTRAGPESFRAFVDASPRCATPRAHAGHRPADTRVPLFPARGSVHTHPPRRGEHGRGASGGYRPFPRCALRGYRNPPRSWGRAGPGSRRWTAGRASTRRGASTQGGDAERSGTRSEEPDLVWLMPVCASARR